MGPRNYLYIGLVGPPGPESEFVDIKDEDGKSVCTGQWCRLGDFWVLRVDAPRVDDGAMTPADEESVS